MFIDIQPSNTYQGAEKPLSGRNHSVKYCRIQTYSVTSNYTKIKNQPTLQKIVVKYEFPIVKYATVPNFIAFTDVEHHIFKS